MVQRSTELAGKVVIVTGAGHGIGRAVAERFALEGARVVVNDLDQSRADEVARALGGDAIAVRADVARTSDVEALFGATLEQFGTVDVLVNNAGNIYAARHFLEADEAWWDQVPGVNLKGAFRRTLDSLSPLRACGTSCASGTGRANRAGRSLRICGAHRASGPEPVPPPLGPTVTKNVVLCGCDGRVVVTA